MGLKFSCVKCVDVSDNGDNLHKKQKRKRKEKTIKTTSSQDQTSHQVTYTSAVEVLIVAEEPGHVDQVDDEWSDAAFQALVGDSSEWGADAIDSLSCVWSIGDLQATVCATSDDSIPVQDVAYYRANVPRVPARDVACCRANVTQVPVRDVADCSVDVPQVPVSTTSAPGLEMADCCDSDSSDDLLTGSNDDLSSVSASPWATSDSSDDLHPGPAWSISDCSVGRTSELKQLEENEIINVGVHSYKIVRNLGEGGLGSVYAGIRLTDGLEVALKFAGNMGVHWMRIEDCPELVPKEIALLIRAKKGIRIPEIIQLLDWVVEPERYIMVLEYPTPCEDLDKFLNRHDGIIGENIAKVIMCQATLAAQICCLRGVLHRGIKPENLLINPNSLDVKLIDFGCGEILTDEGYTIFAGTIEHCPPEYMTNGEYHGKPATVWSLGLLMFTLLHGRFPKQEDLEDLNDNNWAKDGLSQECCELLCALLQTNPETRLELENVCVHKWFKCSNDPPEDKTIIDVGVQSYEVVRKLSEGDFGSVYAGIRLTDGLEEDCVADLVSPQRTQGHHWLQWTTPAVY
ncbi:aurora kinase-like isoform X1 [Pimephales promelas]|uniref:aurora kinase-like isoform X1 n=1 Tax=Pimephales promelas TaxID=90988 RepID=UPI0019554FDE|nr:aurora kinase-like isoform X1 [Pimephales promelas]